jgi:hypothetical protein
MNVEKIIWKGLFRLARGQLNVSQLVQNLAAELSHVDLLSVSDLDYGWFRSGEPILLNSCSHNVRSSNLIFLCRRF